MSWIVAGLTVGSSLYKGFSTFGNAQDVSAGKSAAKGIYQDKLDLLGDVKTQAITGATQQAELGFDVTQSQTAAAGRESVMGAQVGMRGVTDFTTAATSQSGLATSGTINRRLGYKQEI